MPKLLFLAVLLFLTQMIVVVHGAEHGFEEHEHDGDVCEIYLYFQHTDHQILHAVIAAKQSALSPCVCPRCCFAESIETIGNFTIRDPPRLS